MDFPSFGGERPRSWQQTCESYFRVFAIVPEFWIDTATIHFTGHAMRWLENSTFNLDRMSWEELCAFVCAKFERDDFQQLLRQLFHIHQVGTIAEYESQFSDVMHYLIAHSPHWDPMLFMSRFIDGLRTDIRAVILVHKPQDLDAAVELAFL